jgi:hypothetical protein
MSIFQHVFKVNARLREHEVVSLRWSWEVRVPELDTSAHDYREAV